VCLCFRFFEGEDGGAGGVECFRFDVDIFSLVSGVKRKNFADLQLQSKFDTAITRGNILAQRWTTMDYNLSFTVKNRPSTSPIVRIYLQNLVHEKNYTSSQLRWGRINVIPIGPDDGTSFPIDT